MVEGSRNHYIAKEKLLVPTVREPINTLTENAERYQEAISGKEYHAIVTDLDGVFLRRDEIDRLAFDTLIDKTLLNPEGRIPLSLASGRTVAEIGSIILPEIHSMMEKRKAEDLRAGDLLIFASNGSVGIDASTFDILYASPLSPSEIAKAQTLEELQAILEITQRQSVLLDEAGKKVVGRAKIINDSYTYTLGLNPQKLDVVAETGEEGRKAVEQFKQLYGTPDNLISVAQKLNKAFEKQGITLTATTSGALIDINAKGVSKALALQVTRQILAKKTGMSLGEIKPEEILSLGDSTLGNDEFLTQREGGFTNVGFPLPGSPFPIIIAEEGDQFEKVAKFLERVKVVPFNTNNTSKIELSKDYLIPPDILQEGMPNGEIKDEFDITGAKKISLSEARNIVNDPYIAEDARQFFVKHASVRFENGQQTVFLRGRPYYEQLSQANSKELHKNLTDIQNITRQFDVFNDIPLSENQRTTLLCLLDYGKAYALRLLNTEVEYGFHYNNGDNINSYSSYAENLTNNYYRTLLNKDRKPAYTYPLPQPHELEADEQKEFIDLMREMDQPLPIAIETNHITEVMQKTGKTYDFIITPFYGAAELGFVLRSMMEIKGMDKLPDVIPVRFSGQKARDELRQQNIFPKQLSYDIVGKSLLIFDDNSGTGTTIRKLKEELDIYSPRIVDATVVQVGTTTRVERVLNGEKINYNRAILTPEDIAYKGAQVYNLKESMKKAQQFIHHVSLEDYLYRFLPGAK